MRQERSGIDKKNYWWCIMHNICTYINILWLKFNLLRTNSPRYGKRGKYKKKCFIICKTFKSYFLFYYFLHMYMYILLWTLLILWVFLVQLQYWMKIKKEKGRSKWNLTLLNLFCWNIWHKHKHATYTEYFIKQSMIIG